MKALKVLLKIAAVCAAVAGVLFLVAAYWDKLTELFARRGELKEKAVALKDKIPSKEELREKLPTKEELLGKIPTKEDLIRLNPFRKAEIEAEFADYADVE